MPDQRPIRALRAAGVDAQGGSVAFDQTFQRWLEEFQRCHDALEARVTAAEAAIVDLSITLVDAEARIDALESA